jgi:hypothetical protein
MLREYVIYSNTKRRKPMFFYFVCIIWLAKLIKIMKLERYYSFPVSRVYNTGLNLIAMDDNI